MYWLVQPLHLRLSPFHFPLPIPSVCTRQCHSCRKPYFGGLVSCEPAAPPAGGGGAGAAAGGGAAREAEAAERALADIKPEELLCGKCSAGSGGASCSEHGQVGVVYFAILYFISFHCCLFLTPSRYFDDARSH